MSISPRAASRVRRSTSSWMAFFRVHEEEAAGSSVIRSTRTCSMVRTIPAVLMMSPAPGFPTRRAVVPLLLHRSADGGVVEVVRAKASASAATSSSSRRAGGNRRSPSSPPPHVPPSGCGRPRGRPGAGRGLGMEGRTDVGGDDLEEIHAKRPAEALIVVRSETVMRLSGARRCPDWPDSRSGPGRVPAARRRAERVLLKRGDVSWRAGNYGNLAENAKNRGAGFLAA